jgi:hypothetical protein
VEAARRRIVIRAEETPIIRGDSGGVKAGHYHRIIVRGMRGKVNKKNLHRNGLL